MPNRYLHDTMPPMGAFEISRSTTIVADPARVHELINDFRNWGSWSPWEGMDPDMERTYSEPSSGTGARYGWMGNRKAGEGSMEITSSTQGQVDILLSFLKPWRATNDVTFTLTNLPGDNTHVTWSMRGESRGLSALFAKVFRMDTMLGKDFEKGLSRLKSAAEG